MAHTLRWKTFDALHDRNFRWLWVGQLASSATFQMGTVAQGWLVYQLTGSAFALGWVSSGWSIATLTLSLYGGAIADRVEKRDLLIWTRLAMVLNTLAIAVLISLNVIQIWHLMVNSLVTGVLFSFMMPASQAILSDLVPREALLNAMSLNSVGMGLMGIFSASLAGYLVQKVGVQGPYYVMAGFYLMALFSLTKLPRSGLTGWTGASVQSDLSQGMSHLRSVLRELFPTRSVGGLRSSVRADLREGIGYIGSGLMKLVPAGPAGRSQTSVWADLWEGVHYIRSQPVLLALLSLALARVLFAMPYRTFMPKFAQDVMGMGASGLGVLMAAPGLGGLISSLATASLGDFRGKGKLLLASGVVMGGALILFSSNGSLTPVLIFLALVGAASNGCMVFNNTLLQANSRVRVRGRVMSVYMMMWGLTPLGTMPAGIIADRMGVGLVISLQGGVLILIFLAMGLLWPRMRKLE